LKRLSLGFNGLVSAWYWMRTLQYVGRKVMGFSGKLQMDDLRPLDLRILGPLLNNTTTLDPQFMAAYEYGAMVLSAVDDDEAIKLLQKGIAANPSSWKLYQYLGYIYWQRHDYQNASETYGAGAKLDGAPRWMASISAYMVVQGGGREAAREMYLRMYQETDDQQFKEVTRRRLMQLDSFDQRDAIRRVLQEFAAKSGGRCASSWKQVAIGLAAVRLPLDDAGAPLDPAGIPYRLVKDGCDVDLDVSSEVPYQ
jgi:tetratricopeptide (TPR) repeat protein